MSQINFDLSNQEAEVMALAGFLKYPESYWSLNDSGVVSGDFLGIENKRVMQAISAVTGNKKQPDLPSVIEVLKGADNLTTIEYLNRLMVLPVAPGQAQDSARIVKNLSVNRQLALAGSQIAAIAAEKRADADSALAEAESILRKVSASVPQPDRSPEPADILRRLHSGGPTSVVRIRWSQTLQEITGGLLPGQLWVIGGFSSTGKSAMACNMLADVLSERDKWAMLVSTEMTQERYMIRMMSLLSGIPQRSIRERVILPFDNVDKLKEAELRLARSNLRIYDTIYRMKEVRSQATRMKETLGLDVLFVDFLQNLTGDQGDYGFADVHGNIVDLQKLAKDLDCTVVVFSQLSNEMAKYQIEDNDDNYYAFKGAGSIKDAADIAIMLKRNRIQQSEDLDVHVLKNRDGELRVIQTRIDLPTGKITEVYFDE